MTWTSTCCNAAEQQTPDGDALYDRDTGVCPRCKTHAEYEEEEDAAL